MTEQAGTGTSGTNLYPQGTGSRLARAIGKGIVAGLVIAASFNLAPIGAHTNGATVAEAAVMGTKWRTPAHTAPYVMVEDHTGSAWPVDSAVSYVSQSLHTGFHYGRCVSGRGCIRVYEVNVSDYYGGATIFTGTNGYFTNQTLKINLNDRYMSGSSWGDHRTAIAHELGHAWGLAHDGGYDIMNPGQVYSHPWFSSGERYDVRRLYGLAA